MPRPERSSLLSAACDALVVIFLLAACAAGAPEASPTARPEPPEPSLAWPYPPECDQVEPCPGWNVSVSGTITDPDGRPIEGARVDVEGVGMREMSAPLTDRQGRYDYADYAMAPGTVSVTAIADGYGCRTTELTLRPGETRVVDLVLVPRPGPTAAAAAAGRSTPTAPARPREPVVRVLAARRPCRAGLRCRAVDPGRRTGGYRRDRARRRVPRRRGRILTGGCSGSTPTDGYRVAGTT